MAIIIFISNIAVTLKKMPIEYHKELSSDFAALAANNPAQMARMIATPCISSLSLDS